MSEASVALVDRCPRCLCADCGGPLSAHTATGCGCESCQLDVRYACSLREFLPSPLITYLFEQLSPLLSSHLHEKAARRCMAVAHAAHHALHDYDHPEDANHA